MNRPSEAPSDCKRRWKGGPRTDQEVSEFYSMLVLGPLGSYRRLKNGSGCCFGTTKHNWSTWCQYNVTGRGSMWAPMTCYSSEAVL